MTEFSLVIQDAVTLDAAPPLSEMYTLSPFVWREGSRWDILVRAVPRRDDAPELKIARAYYGRSEDGLRFRMDAEPAIAPGPDEADRDGCEDPTVALWDGVTYVYYTGWNQAAMSGQLMLAAGPDCRSLTKRGVKIPSGTQVDNPKEATIARVADGSWRLFFEYAEDDASKIGLASSPAVDGPWTVETPLFAARPGGWDGWHLSTGPILDSDPQRPVMFYNGATRDAHWRIGWVAFDAEYTRVVARSEEPLVTPPKPMGDYTDIAFAASAVEADGDIFLYYSVADRDIVRATVRRP